MPGLKLNNIRFRSSSWLLTLVVSAYLLIMFNGGFFEKVKELHGVGGLSGFLYMASLFVFLLVAINMFLTMIAIPMVLKPALVIILIASAMACYFMDTYNILIDKTMIQNAMETDAKESMELFSFRLLFYTMFAGVLPALLVIRTRIDYGGLVGFTLNKLFVGLASLAMIGLIALIFYKDYASLFRNNRYVRDMIVPVNYIHGLNSYAKQFMPKNTPDFETLGNDAQFGESWNMHNDKKVVSVIVVGETARSANFSLYDYQRETNEKLKMKDIVSFSNVTSCGTSTAISLPCMFSNMDRAQFDNQKAKYSDNLLDVLQRAGLEVIWLDNNSGCKGVCARVDELNMAAAESPEFCTDGECYDMVLLKALEQAIENSAKDVVIVMHQLGSHGPAYFLRTPNEFQKFKPSCDVNQLQECSQQEIINAYDNTIVYTDYFLSEVINYLESKQDKFDASMLYISDHGESLGENNLYLHGMPYIFAPEEQTHVPMILWMANGFYERFSIDKHCVQDKRKEQLSHDNLFGSVLGMLDIKTSVYNSEDDFFNSCEIEKVTRNISENRIAIEGFTNVE